jgi:hypothetical protein
MPNPGGNQFAFSDTELLGDIAGELMPVLANAFFPLVSNGGSRVHRFGHCFGFYHASSRFS